MKKLTFTFCMAMALTIAAIAQPPQAFTYQAVVRDNMGEILQNVEVGIRVNIHDAFASGTIVYQETFTPTTNQFGLVNLEIGTGLPTIGTFPEIDWGTNSKFIEIEIDQSGGTNYVSMGTSEIVSVPYALYAEGTGNVKSPGLVKIAADTDQDGDGGIEFATGDTVRMTITNDGRVGIGSDDPDGLFQVGTGIVVFENDVNVGDEDNPTKLHIFGETRIYDANADTKGAVKGVYPTEFSGASYAANAVNPNEGVGSFYTSENVDLSIVSGSGNVEVGLPGDSTILHVFGRGWRLYDADASGAAKGVYPTEFSGASYAANAVNPNEGVGSFYTSENVDLSIVSGSGNVDVGLPGDSTILHVFGGGWRLYDADASGAAKGIYPTEFTGASYAANAVNPDEGVGSFYTSENVDLSIVSGSGNVGIGTTNPQGQLQVGDGSFIVTGQSKGCSATGINTTTPTAGLEIVECEDNDYLKISSSPGSGGDVVIVNNDGNVGIGTTDPSNILHTFHNSSEYDGRIKIENTRAVGGAVPGVILIGPGSNVSGGLNLYDANTTAGPKFANRVTLSAGFGTDGINIMARGASGTPDIRFLVTNNETEVMRIESNGNVGIGTSDPKTALHVVGLPGYASDAAAGAGGLSTGAFYQTSGHATLPDGVVMVKQ